MAALRLFLCGDVMTGRGIDQILPYPCDPTLHEDCVGSALDYVRLAEEVNGPIRRPVDPTYIWGVALEEWSRARPDVRIVNLETSVTRSEHFDPKGINYRMSPENAGCLVKAAIDCCVLANNHVLDWGREGLLDTTATLQRLRIKTAGAGRNIADAVAPAVLPIAGKGRVLVFSFALADSGTPRSWAAKSDAAGVNWLSDLSEGNVAHVSDQIARSRQAGDVVVVSLHWGGNWGYAVAAEQTRFAHALIDHAGVSVVLGHSSHHAKTIELYRNRLILYGCGDFINDYEGIGGYGDYRCDLPLMYFADFDPQLCDIATVEVVPLQIRQFSLVRPSAKDFDWVRRRLDYESTRFGMAVAAEGSSRLTLSWPVSHSSISRPNGSSR